MRVVIMSALSVVNAAADANRLHAFLIRVISLSRSSSVVCPVVDSKRRRQNRTGDRICPSKGSEI